MDTATATGDAKKVQHVTKKSSDELLRKFAEAGDSNKAPKKKRTERGGGGGAAAALVEKRSLLPPPATRKTAALLLRQIGIGRAHQRTRDFRNKSLLGTIEKTWRRTLEGASRAFMERHYHGHKRLINDMV